MLRSQDKTIRVEEIKVSPGSPYIGKTIDETGILNAEDITLVALGNKIDRHDYLFNPPKSRLLKEDDVLIVMGDIERINELKERVKSSISL